jgi:hypothetical protein
MTAMAATLCDFGLERRDRGRFRRLGHDGDDGGVV